jgi:hypothetical protein
MDPNAGKQRPFNCAATGAKTKYVRHGGEHFKECRACGDRVREDMQEHWFFGWDNSCPHKMEGGR